MKKTTDDKQLGAIYEKAIMNHTHGGNKPKVINKQLEFFSSKGLSHKGDYLGVVGRGDGPENHPSEGLESHISEAQRMGYSDLRNVTFFEIDQKTYKTMREAYEVLFGIDPGEGYMSKTPRMPNMHRKLLPTNGKDLDSYGPGFPLSDRVTHIDYDITSPLDPKTAWEEANMMWSTYPNLQSTVQVYAAQYGTNKTPDLKEKADEFVKQWTDCLRLAFFPEDRWSVSITPKDPLQDKSSRRHVRALVTLAALGGHDRLADRYLEDIKRSIVEAKRHDALIVKYKGGGGNGKAMVSISLVRGSGVVDYETLGLGDVPYNKGEAERVRSEVDKAIKGVKMAPSQLERMKQFKAVVDNILGTDQ